MKARNKWIRLWKRILMSTTLVVLLAGCAQNGSDTSGAGNGTEADGSTGTDAVLDEPDSGSKMPEFTAKDLDGNTVTESIFDEKDLTVVNIWGTFCNPCVGEMPELGIWAKEMPDNVQLIGLVIDVAGDEDTEHHDLAVKIMENADADFTQIIANQDFADILKNVYGVPTTIFVDKDGNIVGDSIIGANVDGYKKFVEEYLNGQ